MTESTIYISTINGEQFILKETIPFIFTNKLLTKQLRLKRKKLENYIFMQGTKIIDNNFSREITKKVRINISVVISKYKEKTNSEKRYFSRNVLLEQRVDHINGNYYYIIPDILYYENYIRKFIPINVILECGTIIYILINNYNFTFSVDEIIMTVEEYTGISGKIKDKIYNKLSRNLLNYNDFVKSDFGSININFIV